MKVALLRRRLIEGLLLTDVSAELGRALGIGEGPDERGFLVHTTTG